jgi:hypothetical protein
MTTLEHQADSRMVKSKRNIRNLKSIGAVADNKVRSAYML